jgi:hypothetical protein
LNSGPFGRFNDTAGGSNICLLISGIPTLNEKPRKMDDGTGTLKGRIQAGGFLIGDTDYIAEVF